MLVLQKLPLSDSCCYVLGTASSTARTADIELSAPPPADARETVQFGLLGMLMHGAALGSPHWLKEFSAYQAFQFFNIDASGGQ